MPNNWVVTLDYGFEDVVKYYNVIKGENTTLPDADRSGYAFLAGSARRELRSRRQRQGGRQQTFTASWVSIPTRALFPALAGHRAARRSPASREQAHGAGAET